LPEWVREGRGLPTPAFLSALDPGEGRPSDLDALAEGARAFPREPDMAGDADFELGAREVFGARESEREPPCLPLDLDELGRRVAEAIDPTVDRPVIVDRVLRPINGLVEPKLAPPDFSPELDLPLWKFLEEHARDWLLPGVGDLPLHSVVALQSNAVFVDAFLIGANHQTLGELRWRNISITTGWTPLRRFWQRILVANTDPITGLPLPKGGKPDTDIVPIAKWLAGSALGAASHQTDPANAEQLVIVFKTELFRRFPATVVYLTSAPKGPDGKPNWQTKVDVDNPATVRVEPNMTGSVGPDVVFFGFPVKPEAARTHWVVLEEPPPGYRFYTKQMDACEASQVQRMHTKISAQNGGQYAEATFALPVRVFLGALLTGETP
jgi:hypothetical protein